MNIPHTKLDNAKNIMLTGIGGGYDIFIGLPFVYKYPDKNFILVNSNAAASFHYEISTEKNVSILPESFITKEENVSEVYAIGRHGVGLVKKAYQEIIKKHNIDMIFAVDGGVNSLMHGHEQEAGTILEDFISIAAIDDIGSVDKLLCCAGFGAETEENINHYRVLENIAKLSQEDEFLGSFSLTKNMPEFQKYVEQCEKAFKNRKSHIQTKIISAVKGQFGNKNLYKDVDPRVKDSTGSVFISPLTSIYWMFDFNGVAKKNKFISELKKGNTFSDAMYLFRNKMIQLSSTTRPSKEMIPL